MGEIYEVGTSVGSFLMSVGAAEPVPDQGGADDVAHGVSPSFRPRHSAADAPRRRGRG